MSDAKPVHVPLYQTENGWHFEKGRIAGCIQRKNESDNLCNPNNPTGKVFTREEGVYRGLVQRV